MCLRQPYIPQYSIFGHNNLFQNTPLSLGRKTGKQMYGEFNTNGKLFMTKDLYPFIPGVNILQKAGALVPAYFL